MRRIVKLKCQLHFYYHIDWKVDLTNHYLFNTALQTEKLKKNISDVTPPEFYRILCKNCTSKEMKLHSETISVKGNF